MPVHYVEQLLALPRAEGRGPGLGNSPSPLVGEGRGEGKTGAERATPLGST